jgi:hypothetical protein
VTGRFTSEDPLGFGAGDANLNRYVGNGPTNATDPNGMELRPEDTTKLLQRVRETRRRVFLTWDGRGVNGVQLIDAYPTRQEDLALLDEAAHFIHEMRAYGRYYPNALAEIEAVLPIIERSVVRAREIGQEYTQMRLEEIGAQIRSRNERTEQGLERLRRYYEELPMQAQLLVGAATVFLTIEAPGSRPISDGGVAELAGALGGVLRRRVPNSAKGVLTHFSEWHIPANNDWMDYLRDLNNAYRSTGKTPVVSNAAPTRGGKRVWGGFDPETEQITLYKGWDMSTAFEELLHWEDFPRLRNYFVNQTPGWNQARWDAAIKARQGTDWDNIYHVAEQRVRAKMIANGFSPKTP